MKCLPLFHSNLWSEHFNHSDTFYAPNPNPSYNLILNLSPRVPIIRIREFKGRLAFFLNSSNTERLKPINWSEKLCAPLPYLVNYSVTSGF